MIMKIRSLNELYYLTSGIGPYYSELKENVPTAYKKCQNILCAISIYPTLIFSRIAITIISVQSPSYLIWQTEEGPCVDGVQSLSNSHEIYRTAKEKEESPIRTFSIRVVKNNPNDSDLDLHRSFDRFVQDLDSHRGLNDGEDVRIHHISIIEEKVSKIVDNPAYENSQ
jgi:hypothetical protein